MTDIFSDIHSYLFDPDRIPVAMLALVLTAIAGMVTGSMRGNANPFLWMMIDAFPGRFGGRLDKVQRGASDLMARGLFITVLGLVFIYMLGMGAQNLSVAMPFSGTTEIILLSLSLSSGTVWYALLKLYFAQRDKKVSQGSYYTIARSTRIDLSSADDFGITRAGMGFAARSFDKAVVAPVFWYLIAGLPGAYIYAGLAALAWRFGKDGFTKGFGRVPLALEQLMGFAPMLLSGVLMALAGLFTPTGGMTRALTGLLKINGRASYAQGGAPLTAMAHALAVSLGGPVQDLDGSSLKRAWVGPDKATAQLESGHLRRAIYITLMAYLLFMACLMSVAFYSRFLPA